MKPSLKRVLAVLFGRQLVRRRHAGHRTAGRRVARAAGDDAENDDESSGGYEGGRKLVADGIFGGFR